VGLSWWGGGVLWGASPWGAFSPGAPAQGAGRWARGGAPPATPIAGQFWGGGRIFVDLTAMTAATAVYIATVVGASRALYAQGRSGTMPSWLGRLNKKSQVPWNAMHIVYVVTLVGLFFVNLWLRNANTTFACSAR